MTLNAERTLPLHKSFNFVLRIGFETFPWHLRAQVQRRGADDIGSDQGLTRFSKPPFGIHKRG